MRLLLLAFLIVGLTSCNTNKKTDLPELELPSGKRVTLRLAVSGPVQQQGLSGLKTSDFGQNEGMLFVYASDGERRFWMPDTYFPLDIIYLSEDLTVVDIEYDVPHHPGRDTPPEIPTVRTVVARHVLEMRADSPLTDEFKAGIKLKWVGSYPLSGKVQDTHPLQ